MPVDVNVDCVLQMFTPVVALPMFTLAVNIPGFTGADDVSLLICFINVYAVVYGVYTYRCDVSINVYACFINVYINVYRLAIIISFLRIVLEQDDRSLFSK